MRRFLSAESVCAGHPDKLCDFISDRVLDACLAADPKSRVACECMAANNDIIIAGEISCAKQIDVLGIARSALAELGYKPDSFRYTDLTHAQSPDIAGGVGVGEDIGAGDQGTVYGYATSETGEFLPLPLVLAHRICRRLDFVRREKIAEGLLPDGKAQVTVEYENAEAVHVKAVVVSAQHEERTSEERLRRIIRETVLPEAFSGFALGAETQLLINPSGRFVIGGPQGDTGLTGRKIIVDTYGGFAPHGGGAFSGKDASKVDRSAAYAARWIAKNIVAAKLAKRCKVSVSYAIGVAKPVAVDIDTFGTGAANDEVLSSAVSKIFDLRPSAIISALDLTAPVFSKTSAYGHFGREDFTWERTDKITDLLELIRYMN
ncbi:MAG: methionine adenosyltransferase [Oscillospiraceae bacterium]|jgi:S-adenosylmethionine synthetase|nr:methionine adenosyltransferase [Oscillospiraceae bacterium]